MADAPGQPPVVVEFAQTHTPPARVRGPSRLRKHTPRNYDNSGRASRRPRRPGRCGTLPPMHMARWVAPGVALVRNEGNDVSQFAWASQNIAAAAMLLRGVPEPIDP